MMIQLRILIELFTIFIIVCWQAHGTSMNSSSDFVGKQFDSLQQAISWLGDNVAINQHIGDENETTWTIKSDQCRIELCRRNPNGPFVVTKYEPSGTSDFSSHSRYERLDMERVGAPGRHLHDLDERFQPLQPPQQHHHLPSIGRSDLDPLAPGGRGMYADDSIFDPPPSCSHNPCCPSCTCGCGNASSIPPGARFDPVSPFNPLGEPDNDELMPPGERDSLRNPFPSRHPSTHPRDFGKGNAPFGGPFPGGNQPPFK